MCRQYISNLRRVVEGVCACLPGFTLRVLRIFSFCPIISCRRRLLAALRASGRCVGYDRPIRLPCDNERVSKKLHRHACVAHRRRTNNGRLCSHSARSTGLDTSQCVVCGRVSFSVWQSPLFLQRYMRSYSHFMESLPNLHDCFQRLSTLGGGSPEYAAVSLPARQLMLAKRRQPLAEQVQHLVQRISQLAGHSTPLASSVSPGSAATAAAAAAMAASAAAAAAAAASAAAVVAGAAAGGDFAVPNNNTTGAGGVVSGGPPNMNSVGACRSRLAAAAAAAAAATAAVVNLGGSPRGPLMLSTGGGGAGASGVAGGTAGQGAVGSVGCLGPQRAGYFLSGSAASPTAGGGAFLGCFDELLWDYQRCPDTALMCLFVHPHDELRKLALQLYIR